MKLPAALTGIATAFAAFSGLAIAQAPAPEAAPGTARTYCSSSIAPYRSSVYLAYIKSSPFQDSISESGLKSLAARLTEKTSLEESARDNTIRVIGLDMEQDDICFFPVIYYPVTADSAPLSADAQWKLQTYLSRGGFIVFDNKDSGRTWPEIQREILGNVNFGAVEPMPENHTLRKSFYAGSDLPGSLDLGPVYVQVPMGNSHERVSRVIVGNSRSWADAWAGMTLSPGSRAHEQAMRGGVNIIIYAFTGNYKGDQADQLLERLER